MRNFLKSALVAGSLALAGIGGSAAAYASVQDFSFDNTTGRSVVGAWLKPAGTSSWRRITFHSWIAPYGTKEINVSGYSECHFDVRVQFRNGQFAYWTDVNLCEKDTLIIRA